MRRASDRIPRTGVGGIGCGRAASRGRLGRSEHSAHLVRATRDPHPHVRAAAAQALGRLGDRDAGARTLPALMADENPIVRPGPRAPRSGWPWTARRRPRRSSDTPRPHTARPPPCGCRPGRWGIGRLGRRMAAAAAPRRRRPRTRSKGGGRPEGAGRRRAAPVGAPGRGKVADQALANLPQALPAVRRARRPARPVRYHATLGLTRLRQAAAGLLGALAEVGR
ncbi:HEAT repeat domain-containing protein [Streptomyces cylindrosporus]|uniref:HEAT repeat domain-containing protein n=1 Tax=Streptomyces cylindrosporus TaxID=2927583 RepID=UPI0035590E9E